MQNLVETIKEETMKTTQEYLMQRALLLCTEINKKGHGFAFVRYSGHVQAIDIEVQDVNQGYTEGCEQLPKVFASYTFLDNQHGKDSAAALSEIVARLESIARGEL